MITAAVLMCHAPIVVPPIGGHRGQACAATTQAMRRAARHLAEAEPDGVLVISPHAPRRGTRPGVMTEGVVAGDFGSFGHPRVGAAFAGDPAARSALLDAGFVPIPGKAADHGALVPLWFLAELGWTGAVTVVGLPWDGSARDHLNWGRLLGERLEAVGRRWGLVASGDMSHALAPGAPGGYHPRAADFDAAVVDCVGSGHLGDLAHLDPELREAAREDVVDSLQVAAGVLGTPVLDTEVFAYEGPFGVGYLEARLA